MSKFFQSALSVIIQISLAKLGVGLMMNMHIFWGVACMILAVRTPKFLQEFIVTTGGGGGGAIVNNAIPFCAPGADGQGHGKVRWRRMVTMDDLSKAIILLVRVGAVARFIYCMVRAGSRRGTAAQYKKRARNTVIFYVIAESIWQIKDLILYYYS